MKIKTRLQISTIFSVGLTIVLGLVLVLAARAMNDINTKIRIVDETVTGMFELNILTHDYLLNPEERSLTQWRSKHSSIANILVSDEFRSPEEQVVLNDMRQEHDSLKGIFDRLVASQEEHGGGEEDVVYQELRERLSGQLSVRLQKVVSGSLQLADLNRANLVTAQRIGSLIIALTIVFAAVAAGITFWSSTSIVKPIAELTQAADSISKGDFYAAGDSSQRVEVTSRDEFGVLASAFSSMITQLRDSIETLEQRVAERTRALETSMEVSRRLSTILDQKELVAAVVEQVRSAFDYYYAHIYLLDEASGDPSTGSGQALVMAGGTGEAGRTMLARGHTIPAGKGLVGRAAETNSIVLIPDVSQDADWLPNPLLPETKAEVAVPIAIGERVLGVLDVQHDVAGGLGQAEADLIQAIANQVAIALQNTRTFADTKQRAEHEALIGQITRQIQSTATLESTLQVAARELGRALGAQRTSVQLEPRPQ